MDKIAKAHHPKITVLMPVYNGGRYLAEAIESIIIQTFTNFEFLIIDDGSADNTAAIIKSYKDPRIRLIKNSQNKGVVFSLNKGIKQARGKYIARMDADDVSLPERFKIQTGFLDKNPEYGLVGSCFYILDANRVRLYIAPTLFDDEDIKLQLHFQNPLAHGSVMIRKTLIEKECYNSTAKHFEDYDLWARLAKKTKIANLPHPLYCWMVNPKGVTSLNSQQLTQQVRLFRKDLNTQLNLPKLNITKIKRYLKDGWTEVGNGDIESLITSGYQVFLNKYAYLSLKNGRIPSSLALILISFSLNPVNYGFIWIDFAKNRLKNILRFLVGK